MKWTKEQEDLLAAIQKPIDSKYETNVVVYADCRAGTGKTAIVKEAVRRNPSKTFIYTAFNKKIVKNGIPKFGENNCKTFHAFAYKYTFNPKIGGFYPNNVNTHHPLNYKGKKLVVDMLNKYCLSRHVDVQDFLDEQPKVTSQVEDAIYENLELMADRKIPITFNYMLKELHHQLVTGDVRIELDILFVDEAQDLTPVMLEIFGLVQADVKVYLGDTCQDIYSFLDLVSAFTLSVETYELTTSFRLSPYIARKLEPFCKKHIDPTFRITGKNTSKDTSAGYITYTNAEIIAHIVELQEASKRFSLTRPAEEIFEVPLAVYNILKGESNKNPKYWKLVEYLNDHLSLNVIVKIEDLDDDIRSAIKLLLSLHKKRIDLQTVLDKVNKTIPDPNYLVGTAHSVKGLEMGTVTISPDLNKFVEHKLTSVPMTEEEEAEVLEACKLYYVACSRAKHTLLNAKLLDK
jgi:hypothetical protein